MFQCWSGTTLLLSSILTNTPRLALVRRMWCWNICLCQGHPQAAVACHLLRPHHACMLWWWLYCLGEHCPEELPACSSTVPHTASQAKAWTAVPVCGLVAGQMCSSLDSSTGIDSHVASLVALVWKCERSLLGPARLYRKLVGCHRRPC
jgi:hypothetical protein